MRRLRTSVLVSVVLGVVLVPGIAHAYQTKVGLRLRGHLRAVVTTSAVQTDSIPPPPPTCKYMDYRVQKLQAGKWVTIERGETVDGKGRTPLPDRPGQYRAVVGRQDGCSEASSPIRRHAH